MNASRRLTLDELVAIEARNLACEILEKRLASEDLPLPKSSLDIHIDELLAIDPTIAERARERVEKRLDAYSQALAAIGIDPTPIPTLITDLEF